MTATACLEIYVEADCFACGRSVAIAAGVREAFSEIDVRMVDLAASGGAHRHLVVAAPTYILNGRVISLGNPEPETLHEAIRQLQEPES